MPGLGARTRNTWAHSVLSVPALPIFLAVAIPALAAVLVGITETGADEISVSILLSLIPIIVTIGWSWALYVEARRARLESPRPVPTAVRLTLIGAATIAVLLIVAFQRAPDVRSVGILLMIIATFASFWLAADALVRFELGEGARWHHVIGTFLLIVYLFVGIWLLTPRVRRIVETNA